MALPASCSTALNNALTASGSLEAVATTITAAIAAFAGEAYATGLGLLVAAYEEAVIFSTAAAAAINNAIACVRSFLGFGTGGGTGMACANTHKTSTTAQGPGVCCAALAASGLPAVVGQRVAATNAAGKCIVCEIKVSTSKKNAGLGVLVFKRGKSNVPGSAVSCPTSAEGCCALAAA
jgi:hypothetical protein